MKKIKFINYHTYPNEEPKRTGALSAINKVNYIIDVLSKIYDEVEIISPSWIIGSYKGFASEKKVSVSPNVSIVYTPSCGGNSWFNMFVKYIMSRLWLIIFLLKQIKSGDTVIVYHQPTLMMPIKFIRLIKNFRLIIEDEEIYENVREEIIEKKREKEIAYLRTADSYIFPTILLNNRVNINNKPFIISHGTYSAEKHLTEKFNDGKIHCVYAGTFNRIKGGAFLAIAAGKHLNNQYHLHIIGFGNEEETKKIIQAIQETSATTSCLITNDGMLCGDEYLKFLQSCHIGLSTQNPDAQYNETSFPSKILSYMANGLRVVSVKIPVLETSSINDLIYYYIVNNPESIAKTIQSINIYDDYNSRNRIGQLNNEFVYNVDKMLE
ncbi:MAG: glycosyltransferase [Eubacteriales bacterium]